MPSEASNVRDFNLKLLAGFLLVKNSAHCSNTDLFRSKAHGWLDVMWSPNLDYRVGFTSGEDDQKRQSIQTDLVIYQLALTKEKEVKVVVNDDERWSLVPAGNRWKSQLHKVETSFEVCWKTAAVK